MKRSRARLGFTIVLIAIVCVAAGYALTENLRPDVSSAWAAPQARELLGFRTEGSGDRVG